jgi:hypothetical protein
MSKARHVKELSRKMKRFQAKGWQTTRILHELALCAAKVGNVKVEDPPSWKPRARPKQKRKRAMLRRSKPTTNYAVSVTARTAFNVISDTDD